MVKPVMPGSAFVRLAIVFTLAILNTSNAHAIEEGADSSWSLADIVTVPEVTDLRISDDQRFVVYLVRSSDPGKNRAKTEMRRLDLSNGSQQLLRDAATITQLRKIPGSNAWSALMDIGLGVQLYRIDQAGDVSLLVANEAPVLVGDAERAIDAFLNEAPKRVGILSHDWSPDGRWLWYSELREIDKGRRTEFDEAVMALRGKRRASIHAKIDFYVKDKEDEAELIVSRPTSDVSALAFGGRVTWHKDGLKYRIVETAADGSSGYNTYAVQFRDKRVRKDDEQSNDHGLYMAQGIRGGFLSSKGSGWRRLLAETVSGGKQYEYGAMDFTLPDPRSAGSWISRDRKIGIVGFRNLDRPYYGLALIDADDVRKIESAGSLTKCDFDPDLTIGVCVREGLALSPEIVVVRPRAGTIDRIASVSAPHAALPKLKVLPRTWVNRAGYSANGYVVLPDQYDSSKSYPAIFVTHGQDADDRFSRIDMQWNYPVQLFAQAGYVVVLINDPLDKGDGSLAAAYAQWISGKGPLSPTEMQQRLWINGVHSFEDAAIEMADEGLIDIQRIGIAGYSRGSQMVNVTMTQSDMFRAASSGDGSHLEPFSYPRSRRSYDAIFGGSPMGPAIENYRAISPSLRASHVCGAILMQMAKPYEATLDFYGALRDASVPAQITLYPGETPASDETHLFHIPENRMAAMRENLAWFDFWLRGRIDEEYKRPERLENWQKMARQLPARCQSDRKARP